MSQIIDGKKISQNILAECQKKTEIYYTKYGRKPGLVTLLVGNHSASLSYVSLKIKTAKKLRYKELQINLPETITEKELIEVIKTYNQDKTIHGILVQLPLPKSIDNHKIIKSISSAKDVDGFHPNNLGEMIIDFQKTSFLPCTPIGIRELLLRSNIETKGKHIVIAGRSNIVSKPIANILLQNTAGANATVSIVHSQTPPKTLVQLCGMADILIVAIGKPNIIKTEWLRKGVVIIDVGVNRIGTKLNKDNKEIPILAGDIDYKSASKIASAITPVPGGVGPMTIAMLMKNTLTAFEKTLPL